MPGYSITARISRCHQTENFLPALPVGNTTLEIGNVSAEVRLTLLYNHHMLHSVLHLFQAGPFQNARQCPRWDFDIFIVCHRYCTLF